MNYDVMKKWVKALRSGRYKQVTNKMKGVNNQGEVGYCCLGVLCRVVGKRFTSKNECLGAYSTPAQQVIDISGLQNDNPNVSLKTSDNHKMSLAELNDKGKTFKEIVDIIEKEWETL